MDDLYYSGEYQSPEKAAPFNAYLASYNHAQGLLSSISCKSGNDRTYVVRLLIDATAGRPLQKGLTIQSGEERPLLPERLHDYSELSGYARKNADANKFTNSAALATVKDTGGSYSKVSSKWHKYPFLKSIKDIDFLGAFGKYAAHKDKKYTGVKSYIYSKFGLGLFANREGKKDQGLKDKKSSRSNRSKTPDP